MKPTRRSLLVGTGAVALGSLVSQVAMAGKKSKEEAAPAPQPAPAAASSSAVSSNAAAPTGPFAVPALPYADTALEPVISAHTISFHYGKHHKAYADNLNKLVVGTEYEKMALAAVIAATTGQADKRGIFNNAAQLSHHTFYWSSMKAGGGGAPTGDLLAAITTAFGSFDECKKQLNEKATKLFGSGWCWLTLKDGAVTIEQTSNADLPAGRPLLVIDVWEHAYYLDHQNARGAYVTGWLDGLANWDFAAANFAAK